MNKILNSYKIYVMSNGNLLFVMSVNEDDLKDMDNLKELLLSKGIFSITAYDDYINMICDKFKIERCFICEKYVFLDDLDCCNCDEYICNNCVCGDCLPDGSDTLPY